MQLSRLHHHSIHEATTDAPKDGRCDHGELRSSKGYVGLPPLQSLVFSSGVGQRSGTACLPLDAEVCHAEADPELSKNDSNDAASTSFKSPQLTSVSFAFGKRSLERLVTIVDCADSPDRTAQLTSFLQADAPNATNGGGARHS